MDEISDDVFFKFSINVKYMIYLGKINTTTIYVDVITHIKIFNFYKLK